jgi:alkylation response protein AidB-like acyl-CoA dehydrogenase
VSTDTIHTIDPADSIPPGSDERSILAAVDALVPTIEARAEEIEAARRLPPDLVGQLAACGCFRMLVPARNGGAEAAWPAHIEMIRTLARADGSVGWTVMIGSSAPVILGMLPPETFDEVYASDADVVLAGAFNPTGVATPVEGGYRVTGRWGFASGCQHAVWFVGHCVVDDGRMPPIRMMVLPADDVEIADTWTSSGLRGTGSHDFTVDNVFVADDRTFSVLDEGGLATPMGRIPELSYSSLGFSSVALGIAEGALEEIRTLATSKVPMLAAGALASNALFQYQLGEADAQLRGAQALLDAEVADAWTIASAGEEFSPDRRARFRASATWIIAIACAVVDMAYTAGGGSSVYASSPLQRRWRDVHAITQHFAVKADTFTLAGGVLAGQEVDLDFV